MKLNDIMASPSFLKFSVPSSMALFYRSRTNTGSSLTVSSSHYTKSRVSPYITLSWLIVSSNSSKKIPYWLKKS